MAYKLKIGPSQGLKLKGNAGFALPLLGGNVIATLKSGGIWTVALDYEKMSEVSTVNDDTAYVLTWDSASGLFTRLNVTDLKVEFEGTFDGYYQPLDATLTALAGLDSTAGILAQTGADAFARRTLTGTANEITVTNGDGISGNPTVSLPNALTFTGKAVTGGTFDGLTITTSTFNGNTWTAGTGTLTIAAGKTLTASDNATVSGTNTGDQTITLTGDVTGTGTGSFAATIGATKVTSAMLNADVFSTAHSWSGQQTFVAPVLGTPASGVATNLTGTASGLTAGNVTTNANMTGDVTSVGNATTIAANAVSNAKMATMAAYTIKANATGSSAVPTDVSIPALTQKASPVSADMVMIVDSAASNALKYTTVSALAAAGSVASYNGRTGAVTATTTDVPLPNYLTGLTLSTAGSSSTFGIATGFATDSTNVSMMALASAYTKTTSAWAVGSGNGAFDTGSISPSSWYHVYLIKRTDTGVVDVLFSASASSPTLPTNYTLFRRIGTMFLNSSSQWMKFSQNGDEFLWDVSLNNVNSAPGSTAIQTASISVPPGIQTLAILNVSGQGGAGADGRGWIFSPDMNSAGALSSSTATINFGASNNVQIWSMVRVRTNTSSQIKYGMLSATGIPTITTMGWIDDRGKLG